MKSGGQLGRTGDGDFEVGFQVMFQKRKIKNILRPLKFPTVRVRKFNPKMFRKFILTKLKEYFLISFSSKQLAPR